jgi:hypothetical protein
MPARRTMSATGDRAITLLHRLLGQRRDDPSALVLGDELARQWMPSWRQSGRLGDTLSHAIQATRRSISFKLDVWAIYRYSTGLQTTVP